jgi:hypothetical protein
MLLVLLLTTFDELNIYWQQQQLKDIAKQFDDDWME